MASEDQLEEIKQLQKRDQDRVRAALSAVGGLVDKREYDPAKANPRRRGADTEVLNKSIKLEDLDVPAPKAARPNERELRPLTFEELRPAPTVMPSGASRMDMIRPTGHVKEQNIQMLVLMHDLNDPTKNWAFPKEDVLDTLRLYYRTMR